MALSSNDVNSVKISQPEQVFLEEHYMPPLHSVKGNMQQPPSYQQVYGPNTYPNQQNVYYPNQPQQPNWNGQPYYPQPQQPNVVYQPQPQSRSQQSGCQSCIECLCCCTLCAACFVEWCTCCEIIMGCCQALN